MDIELNLPVNTDAAEWTIGDHGYLTVLVTAADEVLIWDPAGDHWTSCAQLTERDAAVARGLAGLVRAGVAIHAGDGSRDPY